ncbi:RHS repeat-associated core domain-containing protein [Myroides odoratus]|uniref:RHS repeat-associated core domain-containing protein n=1 Tax=Myroides odoratus TaxID=256 RepID=UPI002168B9CF|nr:RHS repeat-associated core domain-containing protein [Myroides odoratus]MCS4240305.1 RHS repeat-associated protein [Myroides odoratus]
MMQFFKRYQREISTFILISLLQSFVFEVFTAYAKPIPIAERAYFYGTSPVLTEEEKYDNEVLDEQEGVYTLNPEDLFTVEEGKEEVKEEEETPTPQVSVTRTATEARMAPRMEGSSTLYAADIPYGVIGHNEHLLYDDPSDNLFKIQLADAVDPAATYVLSYELFGASSAIEVAKSINTTTSVGGYLTSQNNQWTRVEEFVSPANLKQGLNTILFTADSQTKYYLVRNLQLEKRVNQPQGDKIQVNDVVRDSLTGKVYVSGVVPPHQQMELFISGQQIPITHHTFEYVAQAEQAVAEPLVVELKEKGQVVYTQVIPVETSKAFAQTKAVTKAYDRHHFEVQKIEEASVFGFGQVALEFPQGSFKKDFVLSMQELRASDYAPTGMALVNVTANNGAYRFLPDGIQFDKDVTVKIPYDVTAIPRGYSAKDIQVFYFDTDSKQWTKVKVIDVLEETQQVVALTNHFTDYLAGVIEEPESPDGDAFAPTTISGIQAVNPTESIPMVSVPQINDKGDAALQFPLILPKGIHGMTPDISVNYNSSADEGDFGLGWSLSVPTISVDTRWGVPLYDNGKETESYLYNGEELLLVQSDNILYAPHKDRLINRVADATFQKAQHNPNQVIKRLGSANNYTWEVTDYATGWIYEYKTYAKGKWYLSRVSDAYKNAMRYEYGRNASGDYQLSKIMYNIQESNTTTFSDFSQFEIEIHRKTTIDSPSGPRRDVKVNNRSGEESKSVDLIDKIVISLTGKSWYYYTPENEFVSFGHMSNEYEFKYKAGQFGRSLLYKIINKNSNNNYDHNFNTTQPVIEEYTFDYHDDIGSGSLFETSGKTYNTFKDYATDYDDFKIYISALGGTEGKSTNFSGGGSIGIVTPVFPSSWIPFSWAATFGANFGGGSSNSETKVMMADIDGDGLPDKVFKDGSKFFYRKNLGDKFSSEVFPIKDLPNLSYSRNTNSDMGFSANIMVGNYTESDAKSASKTTTYMTDVNADGLLDVVDNERVYFGYIDPRTKAPSYSLDSSITPVIILKEEDVAPILNPIPQVDMTNGPMDIVMVWRAPKPGQVRVSGTITKQHVDLENGVKFSIERMHETNMGNATYVLGPNLMLSTRESHNHTLTVVKGDLLFFRAHTNQTPFEELGVKWNPRVEYTGENPDPIQAASRHESSYDEGVLVGTNLEHTFNTKGKYRLEWPNFSNYDEDRVTIRVSFFKKGTDGGGNLPVVGNNVVIYEKTSNIREYTSFNSPNLDLDMSSITSVPSSFLYVKVEVLSDSEINWGQLDRKFKPKLVSLNRENTDVYLTPYYGNYSKVHTSYTPLQFIASGPNVRVTIKNNFSLPACTEAVCRDRYVYLVARYSNGQIVPLVNSSSGAPSGYTKFRYKFNAAGNIVQKQRLNENYVYQNLDDSNNINLTTSIGERFFFEYYTTEYKIGELLDAYQNSTATPLIKVTGGSPAPYTYMKGVDSTGKVKANVYTSEQNTAWGPMFRNWGQFAYKGADVGQPYEAIVGKNIHPFNSSSTTSTGATAEDILGNPNTTLDQVEMNIEDIRGMAGNMTESFAMLLPNKQKERWESHEHLYVSRSGVSPYTRFLTDEIPDLRPPTVPVGNYGAAGINKYSAVKNKSKNRSLGFGMLSIGDTKVDGSSELLNEFMDVNGDGFPDIIGERVQLTAKRGGLSNRIVEANFTISTSIRGTGSLLGGSYAGVRSGATSGAANDGKLNLVVGNQGSASASRSRFSTTNTTKRFYVDINGDGLVDIVQDDGSVLLNYGGVFRRSTTWGSIPFQKNITETKNGGGGGGFSAISNMDISLGMSFSESTSRDQVFYMDLNGDGLPEKIDDGKYYINRGIGFESSGYPVPGNQAQKSVEGGLNGNITICIYFPIPIIFTGPKFCFSFGAAAGRNVSSEQGRYMDFDGDGFMDYVTSSRNESVTVYKSRIKRTNLLKKVTQATGATISLDYDVKNPIDGTTIGTTYKMPYKKWALTKVSVYDGFEGDGKNTTQYAYEYYNGYKDRKERNFFGFGKTKSHLLHANGVPFRTDITEYVQDGMRDNELYMPGTSSDLKQYIYKKGLPKKTYTLDKRRRLLTETTYDYKYYDSRRITGDINTVTTSNTEVNVFTEKLSVLPLVTNMQTKQWIYQEETGTNALVNQMQQKFLLYDKKGNVKKYQDVDRGLTVDITYNLGRKTMPISHKVSLTATNQQLRLTKATLVSNGTKYSSVSKHLSNTEAVTVSFKYNAVGNITAKILPGGYAFEYYYKYDDHIRMNPQAYTGDYFNLVPTRIVDSFGNITRIYPNAFGAPVISVDTYGEQIQYKYDAFNRLLEVKGPYEEEWTIRNKYLSNRKSMTQHNLGDGFILHTSMFTDGLGRVIQVKKQLENDTEYEGCESGNVALRLAVSGKNVYDEFGRVVTNYLSEEELYCSPLDLDAMGFNNLSPQEVFETILTTYYPTTDEDRRKITTTYDDQDRVLKQLVNSSNSLTENTYSFENQWMTHKVVLPEGNTTVSYFDKFGQTVIQNQLGNGQTLSTIFAYDNLGQVKEVANAANHFTRYEYDLLGRVKQKETSAAGRTSYKYDELGQVVEKIDGNDLIINYEYDFNRLIRVSGHEISTKFRYEQGGRLALMDDNTGTHAFKYGKLGEVVEDLKMIRDKNGTQRYFKTKYKYDSWGRILQIIYPDREKVFYRYNSVGQLISMVNQDNFEYLTNVKYTYFDQPYFIQYGNKVEMVQEFDSLERLRAAQFGTRQGNNHLGIFSRNVYRYDRNNNISDVYNEYSQEERLNIGGRYKKNYKYDAFNRLADAYGQWDGKFEVHSYNLEMKYNKDHSIAVKKQSHRVYDRNSQQTRNTENALTRNYQYGDASVPQLTAIEGSHADGIGFYQKFKYMANGNINEIESSGNIPDALEYQKRIIDWDGNNNIIKIKENTGITSTYLYDGKGERVIKRLSGGNNLNINGEHMQDGMYGTDEVLYPSGNLVYTDRMYTKHYYANAKRIASRIGNSDDILYFEREDFNEEEFSTTGPNRPDLSLSSTNRGKRTSIRSVSGPTSGSSRTNGLRDVNGNGSQMSETICRNQIDFLLNSLYNTPEKEYCRRQLLAIIEEFTRYETRCVEPSSNPNQPCLRYERVAVGVDYCLALEKINATGCVKYTDDGLIIDPETGYIYDPLTGIPYDPITKKPIDLGLVKDEEEARRRRLQLECYNLLLDYIHYYEEIDDKPQSYYELLRYYMCLRCTKCEDCAYLPGVTLHEDGVTYIINFCTLVVPPLPRDPDPQPEPEPEFPAEEIGEGEEEEWQDDRQESRPIEANPLEQHGPVWWYHSDHLGSTSYITDVLGTPVQYVEYLPFGEVMVEQSTNNLLENVYKFNGKELDTQTGYYYYGARYYDPGTSIFLSVDPLAEEFPAWIPYHYVHNNPINLIDPTGMAADGWIINEKSGEAKFSESYDGTNTPDGWYYGDAIIGDKTIYNADGTHQPIDSGSENCVSCHHDFRIGDGNDKDLSGNLGGYHMYGGGSDDNGRKRGSIKGIPKVVNADDFGGKGAGGAVTKKNSILGLIQYFSSAISDFTNDKDKAVRETNDTIWVKTKNPMGVSMKGYKLKNQKVEEDDKK